MSLLSIVRRCSVRRPFERDAAQDCGAVTAPKKENREEMMPRAQSEKWTEDMDQEALRERWLGVAYWQLVLDKKQDAIMATPLDGPVALAHAEHEGTLVVVASNFPGEHVLVRACNELVGAGLHRAGARGVGIDGGAPDSGIAQRPAAGIRCDHPRHHGGAFEVAAWSERGHSERSRNVCEILHSAVGKNEGER